MGISLPVSGKTQEIATAKRQSELAKGPPPRLSGEHVHGVILSLDIWEWMGGPAGNAHLAMTPFSMKKRDMRSKAKFSPWAAIAREIPLALIELRRMDGTIANSRRIGKAIRPRRCIMRRSGAISPTPVPRYLETMQGSRLV